MRALFFEEAGPASEVIRHGEIPGPQEVQGHCRVAPLVRPIQPADLAFIAGRYRVQPSFPQPAGLEGVGIVERAPAASGFAPGDRVAFRAPGSWAETIEIAPERLLKVPSGVDDKVASQMALNPLTAWGLLDTARPAPGSAILLTAAGSTVCRLVAQLARSCSLRTIGLVRSEYGQTLSECDETLRLDQADLIEGIGAAAAGRPISALFDSVGGAIIPSLLGCLAPGATALAYGVMDMSPAPVPNALLIYANLTWTGFGIDRWLSGLNPDVRDKMITELWDALARGAITLPVEASYPLSEFPAALKANARSGRTGKILLTND